VDVFTSAQASSIKLSISEAASALTNGNNTNPKSLKSMQDDLSPILENADNNWSLTEFAGSNAKWKKKRNSLQSNASRSSRSNEW